MRAAAGIAVQHDFSFQKLIFPENRAHCGRAGLSGDPNN
jgi:hypothetical protein